MTKAKAKPEASAAALQVADLPTRKTVDLSWWQAWQDMQDTGVWFPVTAPDGSATTIQIKVRGPDAKAIRRAMFENAAEQTTNFWDGTGQQIEAQRRNLQLAALADWRGMEHSGEPLLYSPEVAKKWLRALPFLGDTIDAFRSIRALFDPALPALAPPATAEGIGSEARSSGPRRCRWPSPRAATWAGVSMSLAKSSSLSSARASISAWRF